jgi:hypothetical protein
MSKRGARCWYRGPLLQGWDPRNTGAATSYPTTLYATCAIWTRIFAWKSCFNKHHIKSRCRLKTHSQMLGTTTGNRSLMYILPLPCECIRSHIAERRREAGGRTTKAKTHQSTTQSPTCGTQQEAVGVGREPRASVVPRSAACARSSNLQAQSHHAGTQAHTTSPLPQHGRHEPRRRRQRRRAPQESRRRLRGAQSPRAERTRREGAQVRRSPRAHLRLASCFRRRRLAQQLPQQAHKREGTRWTWWQGQPA